MTNELYSLENLEYFISTSKKSIEQYNNTLKDNDLKIEDIKRKLLTLGEAKKLLIKLKNSKMIDKKDFILNTINTALSDVFNDQNVRIDLVASNTNQEASKLNIKYDIVLYQNNVEMARNEKMLNQNGGGVLCFISILFKILVGFIYSRNRFYVFDESLAEVSEIYLPRIGQFLQKFCSTHKFTIILITHTQAISEFADLAYSLDGEFENGVPTLKIDKVVGEYPEEDYVYSKIENFQSIKKLEFRYKGFTTITGKNNIGKSASFRAINSIIFNNFDIKDYPRFESAEKPDKLLNTKLEFGYFSKKDDPQNEVRKIGFYKKGQSIIWFFDNMEFVGKNLAGEKVKEKVEQIGFKYLKLKEQYKNFKGNLKEQTERLAITTQQDGYYLIGGKTADTSKVFDFLFDSREVTLALIDLNNDIQNFESELNNLVKINGEITFILSKQYLELKKWELLFKIKTIDEIKHLNNLIEFNNNHQHQIMEELKLINNIILVADIIWKIEYEASNNESLNYKANVLNYKVGVISKIIDLTNKTNILNQIKNLNIMINILSKKYKLFGTQLNIIKINEIISVYNIYNNTTKIFNYLRSKSFVLDKLLINLQSRLTLETTITEYDNFIIKHKRYNLLNDRYNLLNSITSMYEKYYKLMNIVSDIDTNMGYKNRLIAARDYNLQCLNLIDKSIIKAKAEDLINSIFMESEKIKMLQNHSDTMRATIEELPATFGLTPCKVCSTLGYTHIH